MKTGAHFSPERTYRYALWRQWEDETINTVMFIGLNPSTADENADDPTIRRCIGFAKRLGFTRLVMTNLFALRATDPKEMLAHPSPVGLVNNQWLEHHFNRCRMTIAAWGAHGSHQGRDRQVRDLLGGRLFCFGTTAKGQPRHPLYLRADAELCEL